MVCSEYKRVGVWVRYRSIGVIVLDQICKYFYVYINIYTFVLSRALGDATINECLFVPAQASHFSSKSPRSKRESCSILQVV